MIGGLLTFMSTTFSRVRKSRTVAVLVGFTTYTEEFYPFGEGSEANTHDSYIRQSLKSMIASAVYIVTTSSAKPDLWLFAKPAKKVVSDRKFKVGELVLVLASLTVSSGKPDDKPATATIVTTNFKHDSSQIFWLNAPAISTDVSKKSLVAPFWLIPRTSDADKVNVEIHKISVKVSMDLGPKGIKSEYKIDFETFRNSKAIKDGDELFALEVEALQPKKKKQRRS